MLPWRAEAQSAVVIPLALSNALYGCNFDQEMSSARPSMKGCKGMAIQQETRSSLYERLGGVYSIAVVVDELIDRVMRDPRLNANPAVDEAHHRVPPAGFKYLATEMVCWATGGPQKYTGRSMADSHRHLNITPQEWDAFMDDFQQTVDKFNVPAREQGELRAIVESTYSDIVVKGAS
jgi:hemoglobin